MFSMVEYGCKLSIDVYVCVFAISAIWRAVNSRFQLECHASHIARPYVLNISALCPYRRPNNAMMWLSVG